MPTALATRRIVTAPAPPRSSSRARRADVRSGVDLVAIYTA